MNFYQSWRSNRWMTPDHAQTPSPARSCLIGGAVGDALGLPFEGLAPHRVAGWWRDPGSHRFLAGRGMLSDDTDHAVFVAQALLLARGDVDRFTRHLAWRLRLWLLTLPAGIGWATLRACVRLCCGLDPARSGVWSAGNGPCMRSALIGSVFARDALRRRNFVRASTLLTHIDPQSLAAATAVADVAAQISTGAWKRCPTRDVFLDTLRQSHQDLAWQAAVNRLGEYLDAADPIQAARADFGGHGGISGYALHSVPFALICWFIHFGDYPGTLRTVILAGGDTDTVGAIAGALAALSAGMQSIPPAWVSGICDWPHSRAYIESLGLALDDPAQRVSTRFCAGLWLRSPLFLLAVLGHAVRRFLPPY
jgi:ADP-ribosyl-[dinitrogen reductase] hydrolase